MPVLLKSLELTLIILSQPLIEVWGGVGPALAPGGGGGGGGPALTPGGGGGGGGGAGPALAPGGGWGGGAGAGALIVLVPEEVFTTLGAGGGGGRGGGRAILGGGGGDVVGVVTCSPHSASPTCTPTSTFCREVKYAAEILTIVQQLSAD